MKKSCIHTELLSMSYLYRCRLSYNNTSYCLYACMLAVRTATGDGRRATGDDDGLRLTIKILLCYEFFLILYFVQLFFLLDHIFHILVQLRQRLVI